MYKSVFEERFYLWPIPQSEIDKNNGGVIQNPDYK
ncbi:RagB/SusD family nutrient uptake outer membrane protein [Parabacteroides merdae]